MRKLALALAFLMIIPGAAFGLEMMNDTSMDDVTGQSGVTIAVDDIQIFLNIDKLAWLDCDGYECGTTFTNNAGAVGISNFQLDVLKINAPDTAVSSSNVDGKVVWDLTNSTACSEIPLQYDYGDTTTGSGCSLVSANGYGTQTLGLNNYTSVGDPSGSGRYIPAALTIDATSQLPVLTTANYSKTGSTLANVGGVRIGLPTVEIDIPVLSMTPAFYNIDGAAQAVNDVDGSNNVEGGGDDADYGTIALEGVTMTVLSGWVEIAPH